MFYKTSFRGIKYKKGEKDITAFSSARALAGSNDAL
jgi:hypothetical protein